MRYLLDCPGCWYDYQTPLAQQPTSKQLEALTAIQKNLEHLWVTESSPDWYTVFVDTQLLAVLNLAKPASIHGLYVRAGFAVRNLFSKALLFERNITRKFGAKHAKSLPRWQMLNAAAESKSLLSWDSNSAQLRTALVQTLRSDPSPYVRLEALRAIGAAPIPLSWTGPLLEAIQGAEATLAETPFTQAERQALAKYLADVTSKLQAAAAPSFPAVTVPGINEPVTTLDLQLDSIDPNRRAWLPWVIAAAAAGTAVAGAVLLKRRQHRGLSAPTVRDIPDDLHSRPARYKSVLEAADRAVAAGASEELEFIGLGAEGVVFCDADRAYKVGRWPNTAATLEDEADFLKKANQIPSIRQHIAKFHSYDKANDVIIRECVRPRGTRRGGRNMPSEDAAFDLSARIDSVMRPYGFTGPERKRDSFVHVSGRGLVLVDAGFAHRRGGELVKNALAVVNGRAPVTKSRAQDLVWALATERDRSVPAKVADSLIARLRTQTPGLDGSTPRR